MASATAPTGADSVLVGFVGLDVAGVFVARRLQAQRGRQHQAAQHLENLTVGARRFVPGLFGLRVAHQRAQLLAIGLRIIVEKGASALSPSASRRSRQSSTRCIIATSRRPVSLLASSASRIASSVASSSRRMCLARNASWRLWAMWAVMRLHSAICGSRSSGIGRRASWAGSTTPASRPGPGRRARRAGSGCGSCRGIHRFLRRVRASSIPDFKSRPA